MSKHFLLLDTETGGLDSKKADVLQVAWQITDDGFRTVLERNFFMVPTLPVSGTALSMHGLGREFLDANASAAAEVYGTLDDDLAAWKPAAVIGHYVDFDKAFIKADCARRLPYRTSIGMRIRFGKRRFFDSRPATAFLDTQWRKRFHPGPQIWELCSKLHVDVSDLMLHRADGDVEALRRCLDVIKREFPDRLRL